MKIRKMKETEDNHKRNEGKATIKRNRLSGAIGYIHLKEELTNKRLRYLTYPPNAEKIFPHDIIDYKKRTVTIQGINSERIFLFENINNIELFTEEALKPLTELFNCQKCSGITEITYVASIDTIYCGHCGANLLYIKRIEEEEK